MRVSLIVIEEHFKYVDILDYFAIISHFTWVQGINSHSTSFTLL